MVAAEHVRKEPTALIRHEANSCGAIFVETGAYGDGLTYAEADNRTTMADMMVRDAG